MSDEVERFVRHLERNHNPNDELQAIRQQTLLWMSKGLLVATIDVDGMPFHLVTSATISSGDDKRLVLWLDPQKLDHNWQPDPDNMTRSEQDSDEG